MPDDIMMLTIFWIPEILSVIGKLKAMTPEIFARSEVIVKFNRIKHV